MDRLKAVAAEAKKVATNKDFEVVPVHTDVTNEESVRNMVETTVKSLGRIDYACNNAGVRNLPPSPFPPTPCDYQRIFPFSLKGFAHTALACRWQSRRIPWPAI